MLWPKREIIAAKSWEAVSKREVLRVINGRCNKREACRDGGITKETDESQC
jgi:hypothetical protein